MAIQDPVDYGTDIALNRDSFRYVYNTENLALQLERRLKTKKGSIRWAPDEGIDVREYVNKKLSSNDITDLSFLIKKELERDERVESVSVSLKFLYASFTLKGDIQVNTVYDTSFKLVLSVSNLTFELLVSEA
ncbi:MAG: hypothetical protein FMNOHCHN_03564 [Ignavibacteriaceae bacterium]|nr:hypothetical protein [Ignavibacteriaceae bacterium]